jgi:peptide/nickel transport system substrate-binding protein
LFSQWYQCDGKKGEEPPQEIKDMMSAYDKIIHTVSDAEKKALFNKILAENEKNLWVIGLVHDPPDFYVVSPKMINVPKKDFQSWTYPNPGPIYPEQFSYDKGKR